MWFLLLACTSSEAPVSYTTDFVMEEGLTEEQIALGITTGLAYWERVKPSELYLFYLEQLENREPDCPRIFPAAQQSQGWNNDCETAEGWSFSGRSQFRYEQDLDLDGVSYAHLGYFISNLTILSPEEDFFLMQGYGDLRVSEQEKSFALVGSFGASGDDISWISELVSLQLQKSVDLEHKIVHLSGGVSYFEEFSEEVLAFRFEGLQLDYRDSCRILDGEIVVAGASGQREYWSLDSQEDCEICRESGRCWSLYSLVEQEQW